MARLINLQAQNADMRQRVARNARATVGLGNTNPYSQSAPNVIDPLNMSAPGLKSAFGGVGLTYGVTPNDAQIDAMFRQQYGSPAVARRMGGGSGANAASMASSMGASPGTELFAKLVQSFQDKIDEANAANDARYNEALGEATDLRSRNQDRVQNWGVAASQDIDERMKETLSNQRAHLASRGMLNSTIMPSFEGRVARDTAREQQRVSEMRDSRASQYDSSDTERRMGILERREDVAPSYEQLINLATQYGQSGMGQGMDAVRAEIAGLRNQVNNQGYQRMSGPPSYGPLGGVQMIDAQSFYGPSMPRFWVNSQAMGWPQPQQQSQPQQQAQPDGQGGGFMDWMQNAFDWGGGGEPQGVLDARARRHAQEAKTEAARRARVQQENFSRNFNKNNPTPFVGRPAMPVEFLPPGPGVGNSGAMDGFEAMRRRGGMNGPSPFVGSAVGNSSAMDNYEAMRRRVNG